MKYAFILFTTAACLAACSESTPGAAIGEPSESNTLQLSTAQMQSAQIQVGSPDTFLFSGTVSVTGRIDIPPQNLVSISCPLGGFLKKTHLLPGARVRKGEVIAELQDVQFVQLQEDYLSAKTKLDYLKLEFERQKDLNKTRAVSDKSLQQVTSELKTQEIMVNAMREKLAMVMPDMRALNADNIRNTIQLTSPIDGFVANVFVNIGKYVQPTDVLFELIDPRYVHLNLTVFENDVRNVKIGQSVVAWANQQPETKYPATVILLGQNLDANRSIEVHCHFDEYHEELIPGMFMNADISMSARSSLSLPAGAVVRWENGSYVFVQRGAELFEMVRIHPISEQNDHVELGPEDTPLAGANIITQNAYAALMAIKNKEE